ncbi:hypothetical protein CYG48_08965 [Neorhizobium sp. SOG26]|uniref:hypothetical protein n=1 Tax=Neorhizobium sp. SOG26 TaxID=2060726 RepID=UPI000E56B4C5|nr:hypothetical protein [Neorhizobium sp. SOG26]AXV15815.1 hypothetical protein CYG48_08965 [Neorhizobium sp. SOG26]
MQTQHITDGTVVASAKPLYLDDAVGDLYQSAAVIRLSASALRAHAPDGDVEQDVVTALGLVDGRLCQIREMFNAGCEADYKLFDLIDRYRKAKAAWDAVLNLNQSLNHTPEEDAHDAALMELVAYQCQTLGGVHHKARVFLQDESLLDTLRTARNGPDLEAFLASLMMGAAQ